MNDSLDDVDLELAARTEAREQADAQARQHDLYRVVELGLDAEKFLQGTVGQVLVERADRARQSYLEELATIDVETVDGRTKHRDLRLQIGILENPFAMLMELIQEGKDAEVQLLESEQAPL